VPGLIGSVEYDLASTADLEETERQVTALGGRMLTATADVRDMASLADAVAAGVERFGRLDTVDQTVPTG
jgi:(+)-trans-carveol dehydrogenase